MVKFSARIEKYGQQGEKTGWTYLLITADMANRLNSGKRQSFRVKGKLDDLEISGMALIPIGDGQFILPLKADLRRLLKKKQGDLLDVRLSVDERPFEFNADFMQCLEDEPLAFEFFKQLTGSHQRYFSKWIDSAKTAPTRDKRIAMAVNALAKKWGYAEMIRAGKNEQ